LGIREDLLGRAAKESAFNNLDLYLSAVEMEIFTVVVEMEYRGEFWGGPTGLDAIKT